ncbi:hypothetical protein WJX82_009085 [Trebouxia sp. C0006]
MRSARLGPRVSSDRYAAATNALQAKRVGLPRGGSHSVTCRAEQQARMGHKRVLLLAHGKKAETPEFKEAYAWLEKVGHHIDLMKTGSPEDMSKGVKKLIAHFDDYDILIAAGGDGTINQVVNELVDQDAPKDTCLAVLPLGTANDFATSLTIRDDNLVQAMQTAVQGVSKPVDVATANGKSFLNMATGGFGTEAAKQTDSDLKDKVGGAAYLITGMTKVHELASKHAKARAPSTTHDSSTKWQKQEHGEKGTVDSWEGDLLVLAVGNAQQAGGGMKMCPEAKIDDGLLDITYVQNVPPEKVPELLQTLAMGGRDNDDLAESIKTMRVPWLEVECSDDLSINCDGEPLNDKKYKFEIQKHRIRLMVPPTAKDLFQDSKDLEDKQRQKEKELEAQAPAKAVEMLENLAMLLLSKSLDVCYYGAGALYGSSLGAWRGVTKPLT